MIYNIPGAGNLELRTLILDLNGTLTVKGEIPKGVKERLAQLKEMRYRILFFTSNTRNNADEIAKSLGIEWILAPDGIAKREEALKLNPDTCVAIGNGLIDLGLMKVVKLGIVTLQAEGVHVQTLLNSDIVVPSINDALDMLIDPSTLIATLRR
jgi:soluble P-type ATPase